MEVNIVIETVPHVQHFYFPGSTIQGFVKFRCRKEKEAQIHAVYLWLYGGAHVFEKRKFSSSVMSGATFSMKVENHETYLHRMSTLYPPTGDIVDSTASEAHENGQNSACPQQQQKLWYFLPGMEGELPFSLSMPVNLPSSLGGLITYQLVAVIDCGRKSFETTLPIDILHDLDLNEYMTSASSQPWMHDSFKEVNQFRSQSSCNEGILTVVMECPKRWFVIGEVIRARIKILNNSSKKLCNVALKLSMHVTFKGYSSELGIESKIESRRTVASVRIGKVGKRESIDKTICTRRFTVPAVPGSGLWHCNIADVQYSIQLTSQDDLDNDWIDVARGKMTPWMTSRLYDDWEGGIIYSDCPVIIGVRSINRHENEQPPAYDEAVGTTSNDQEAPSASSDTDLVPNAPET